ncbi:hypothetical protein MBLNU13_g04490t1 [Cladosporium sp. NU13]
MTGPMIRTERKAWDWLDWQWEACLQSYFVTKLTGNSPDGEWQERRGIGISEQAMHERLGIGKPTSPILAEPGIHIWRALQQERIRSLLKTKDEAKVRCTMKSLILRKAKVMSLEDLVKARAKGAEKDARKAAKKQRRKRKGEQEVVPDATLQVPLAAATEPANGQLWMAQAQYAEAPNVILPYPGAAPVVRMW